MSRPALLALLLCALPAHAEIYKFVDENGFVTYTNMPRPGARPQLVITDRPRPAASPEGTASAGGKKAGGGPRASPPSYFPKVDKGTQRKRDDMRRKLLEEELGSEQRNLDAARAAFLAAGRQPGANLNKLSEGVRLHEKNIEMLMKELSHIR